jgi:DNA transformation protein and related proteins
MATNKSNPSFAAHVVESFSRLGLVQTRPMFGGHNVSLDGLTFGLIAYDVLYLKADEENKPMYLANKLGPFVYHTKDGKQMAMSYYQAPDALEDWETMEPWVRAAIAAAQRGKHGKSESKGKAKSGTKKPARASATKVSSKKAAKVTTKNVTTKRAGKAPVAKKATSQSTRAKKA